MDEDLLVQLGMSDKLAAAWRTLKMPQSGFSDSTEIAAYIRREMPGVFDLRKPGDCWVWCYAVQ